MAEHETRATRDHGTIRRWAEARGGKPASVQGTRDGDPAGVLRIDFPGYGEDEKMNHISWEDFFEKFDASDLVFLYQERTKDGGESRFSKFASRESVDVPIS